MSATGEEPEADPLEEKNEDKDLTNNPEKRSKIIREAMRDVLVSVILLVLTALVTHGDFEKSPASSILASGMSLFPIQLMFENIMFLNQLGNYKLRQFNLYLKTRHVS
jgi:hypothetical protein